MGTIRILQSSPYSPDTFTYFSGPPTGPAKPVTSFCGIPFFGPFLKDFRNSTDAAMHSVQAIYPSNVLHATIFEIHGTISDASVQDGGSDHSGSWNIASLCFHRLLYDMQTAIFAIQFGLFPVHSPDCITNVGNLNHGSTVRKSLVGLAYWCRSSQRPCLAVFNTCKAPIVP
jgi:hypothetical protein